MLIDKTEIMALLLFRGREERAAWAAWAAWVGWVLAGPVDTRANASVLKLLTVDRSTVSDAKKQRTEHRT